MPSLNNPQRRIDDRSRTVTGGGGIIETGGATTGPAIPLPPPPSNLRVTSVGYVANPLSPTAILNLAWTPPRNVGVTGYRLQWATEPAFLSPTTLSVAGEAETAAVEVTAGGTVYVRMATVARAGLTGNYGTAISQDLTISGSPPDAPTSLSLAWDSQGGTLVIGWTAPATPLRDYRVRIYTANPTSGGTLLREVFIGSTLFAWTIDMQRVDRGALILPAAVTAYVAVTARSWGGGISSDLAGSVTLSPPGAPTGLVTSWDADGSGATAGLADEDITLRWNAATVAGWTVRIGSAFSSVRRTSYQVSSASPRFTYTYAQNAADTDGFGYGLFGEYNLGIELTARDVYGQTSTATTRTAANRYPPTPTITLEAARVGTVALRFAFPDFTEPLDFDYFEVVVAHYPPSGGVNTSFVQTRDYSLVYTTTAGKGFYEFAVRAYDKFGRGLGLSAYTDPVDLNDVLDLDELRSGVTYRDNLGTAPATLKAQLADDVRTSGGISYPATWNWTEADRQIQDRIGLITLATDPGGAAGCVGISQDGVTYRWYGQPFIDGNKLTYIASGAPGSSAEVAARAVGFSFNGVPGGGVELSDIQEARYIRISHINSGPYQLYEFYPRSKGVFDDLDAEVLRAIEAHFSYLEAGRIYSVLIEGAIIQTAASGQRVLLDSTGLKTYDSANNVQIEATTATNGALRAGAGSVVLDRTGIRLVGQSNTVGDTNWLRMVKTDGALIGGLGGYIETNPFGTPGYQSISTVRITASPTSGPGSVSLFGLGRDDQHALLTVTGRTGPSSLEDAEVLISPRLRVSGRVTCDELAPGGTTVTSSGVGALAGYFSIVRGSTTYYVPFYNAA